MVRRSFLPCVSLLSARNTLGNPPPKENHLSWVEFARRDGLGEVNPVLVTGVDRTKDFAMMCYSGYDGDLECEFKTWASGIASAPVWGTWVTKKPIYSNQGPQPRYPPTQTISPTPSGNSRVETVSDEFNQCVFIRYISVLSRKLWIPKVMKAAAGPHHLHTSTGRYYGEGSPLQAKHYSGLSSHISSSSSNDDRDDDMGSVTSISSESDVVIHNPTTAVRYMSPPSCCSF